MLFSPLPDSWETLVVSINNSSPNDILLLTQVKEALLNKELRRKEYGIEFDLRALVIEKKEKKKKERNRNKEPYSKIVRLKNYSKSRRNLFSMSKDWASSKESNMRKNVKIRSR